MWQQILFINIIYFTNSIYKYRECKIISKCNKYLSFLYFLQKLFATNTKYLSNVQISLLWITNKFYKPFAFIATLFFSVLSRRILTKSLVKLLQNIEKLYEEHYYNFLKIDKFPMRIEKIYSLSNSPCIVSRERHSERLSREITPL